MRVIELFVGEIDRARAIYSHCSQICDPRVTKEFWQIWKEFEIRHGNEDTMREMLRIKRSVQAMYNTQVNMMSAQMLSSASAMSGNIFLKNLILSRILLFHIGIFLPYIPGNKRSRAASVIPHLPKDLMLRSIT